MNAALHITGNNNAHQAYRACVSSGQTRSSSSQEVDASRDIFESVKTMYSSVNVPCMCDYDGFPLRGENMHLGGSHRTPARLTRLNASSAQSATFYGRFKFVSKTDG